MKARESPSSQPKSPHGTDTPAEDSDKRPQRLLQSSSSGAFAALLICSTGVWSLFFLSRCFATQPSWLVRAFGSLDTIGWILASLMVYVGTRLKYQQSIASKSPLERICVKRNETRATLVLVMFDVVFLLVRLAMSYEKSVPLIPKGLIRLGKVAPFFDRDIGTGAELRLLMSADRGAIQAPYKNNVVGGMLDLAAQHGMNSTYVTGDKFTIVIAARDEEEYIAKTIKYTLQSTPRELLDTIVIVDDCSTIPVESVLNKQLSAQERSMIKVIRFDTKQGLIRARIAGADSTKSPNLFFLDGHCKPKPGWLQPLLSHLKANYKRIACPLVEDIKRETWEDVGTHGSKMMFYWNFEFDWYEDLTDDVPVSAGGILAMTRKWWEESGKYDPGMLEWGGENLEQSMRVWMCGGEILVVRNSRVGHIFSRPAKPNPGNSLVRQVQRNQKRGALVWLDDYYTYFQTLHPIVKTLDEGPGIEARLALRRKLQCKPFQWYVDRFRSAFERRGLLLQHFHHIQHAKSKWCLAAKVTTKDSAGVLQLEPCQAQNELQQWQPVAGGRMLYNRQSKLCFDRGGQTGASNGKPLIYSCDWTNVFKGLNQNQFVLFDSVKSNHIFYKQFANAVTVTGNDNFYFPADAGFDRNSDCLASPHNVTERHSQREKTSQELYMQHCSPPVPGIVSNEQTFKWLW